MPSIHRNLCRVCLAEGVKPIFANGGDVSNRHGGLQYDRLAEKLRFVSMASVVDSAFLPSMLCYTCIVQLNLAYNFKNIVIETTMYLERFAIENGMNGGGAMTPATTSSTMEEEDQVSNISSFRDIAPTPSQTQTMMPPPPPPMSIASNTDGSPSSSRDPPLLSGEEAGLLMIDPSAIKREPTEADVDDFVLNSLLRNAAESHSGSYSDLESRGASTTNPTRTPKRKSAATQKQSPLKRPMVALHRLIATSSSQDKAYLDNILRDKAAKNNSRNSRSRIEDKPNIIGDTESVLRYDYTNSKMIREILSNMPKNRLRDRRTQ